MDRLLIIELFAKRLPNYTHEEVLRLTRSSDEEIAAAVKNEELQPHRKAGGALLYAWEEVAAFAMRRWTPRMIFKVLGEAHESALPHLDRLASIRVELPLYQVRMLHVLASTEQEEFRGRFNASDIIEQQLHALANTVDAGEMEKLVPGFRAALHYPYFFRREDTGS
ncbi:MAG TPA: hypothetical protein VJZ76_12830 [Thermoanaerobaculia bacterium]|nr:hypothetical protein [Thermoanaerobaculia bacterium]